MTVVPVEIIADEEEFIPTKGRDSDACFDVRFQGHGESFIVPARSAFVLDVGFSMNIPDGWAAYVWPRSGLAVKHRIDTKAGVIDAGYQGRIQVVFANEDVKDYEVKDRERIAQLSFVQVPEVNFVGVKSFEESERGEGGFGSSGEI